MSGVILDLELVRDEYPNLDISPNNIQFMKISILGYLRRTSTESTIINRISGKYGCAASAKPRQGKIYKKNPNARAKQCPKS